MLFHVYPQDVHESERCGHSLKQKRSYQDLTYTQQYCLRLLHFLKNQDLYGLYQDFGLKLKRKVDTGLQEEYNASNKTSTTPLSIENILDIFGSYEESGEEE